MLMLTVINIVGLLLCMAGLILLVKPEIVFSCIERFAATQGLYATAIILRVFLGLLLVTFADLSRFPLTVTVIGWLAVIVAVIFAWMGHGRFTRMMEKILKTASPFGRAFGGLALVFGLFLLYAFL